MKQNIKNYLKFGILLIGISCLLYQCQKVDDNEIMNSEPKSTLKVTIVRNIEHFSKSNPKIYNKLQLASQSNVLSRETEYSDDYDFYFNLDNIQIIEKTGYTQYTVVVKRFTESNDLLNYILMSHNNDDEDQYLVTYPRIEIEGELVIDYYSSTIVNLNGNSILSRGPNNCADGTPELIGFDQEYICTANACGSQNHDPGDDSCKCGITVSCTPAWTGCEWTSVAQWSCTGGGGSGTGSGSGGGGSGGSNDDDDDEDEPLETVPLINEPKTPCEKMNKLKADTGFRAKMVELKTAADNENVEKAVTLYNKTGVAPLNDKYLYAPSTGTPNDPGVKYSFYTNTQGFVHTHYEDLISVFSVKDLYDMYFTMKNGLVTDDFFYGVITEAGSAYILQIEDRIAFIAFGDANLSNEDKRFKFTSKLVKYYDVTNNGSIQDNEDGIVKMLQRKNAGLAMFKPTDNTFTDYVKLEYNSGDTIETNCNEN
ncbi:hypothetical protein ES692_08365 [Psychroserpens burtonensis]|uniref:Uncharacterized protein n=1 Tax=Psychroserpens burtonensis TaxID=49278 RepID=A0A5C7B964_9FLAO|nr:hypothetical protein [Psychroserpens burtonensis]TXE17900.1 hypothetical protein ES692_08365 [Psychroserpens burtonensis]